MRLNVLFLSGLLAQNCNKSAEKKVQALRQNITMTRFDCVREKTLNVWSSINEDAQKSLIDMMLKTQEYGKLDAEFCQRLKNNYAPFGLDDKKPDRLDCDIIKNHNFDCPEDDNYNPDCERGEAVTNNLQEPVYEIEYIGRKNIRVPNIVVLGQTGAGKSYFSNGLMGYKNPDKGPFGTGDSSVSCTRKPRGFHTTFFNNTLRSHGVRPMKMNLFDTPGFGDSDSCQIEANKQRIANAISKKIDVFAFLVKHDNPRFDATTQKTFRMLNEWTMGTIWQNFVIVYSRVEFGDLNREKRIRKKTTWDAEMNQKRHQLIENLYKMSQQENWNILNTTDGSLREMVKEDFENIRTSALNVNQNVMCDLSADGISENEHCWKQAKVNEALDYDIEDGPTIDDCLQLPTTEQPKCFQQNAEFQKSSESDKIIFHENEFVLSNEAKRFQSIVKEFMSHPVTPQKLYWEEKMEDDLAEYNKRWDGFGELTNIEVVKLSNDNVDTSECEKNYNQNLALIEVHSKEVSCPRWSEWSFEDCSTKCGYAHVTGTRKCLKHDQELTSTAECEIEYPQDSRNQTSQFCENLKSCSWLITDETDSEGWRKDSECSEACGTGVQSFRRKCNGSICDGEDWKQESCNTHYCEWSAWEEIGSCSKQCAGGEQLQNRRCLGKQCDPSEKFSKYTECNKHECSWGEWSCPDHCDGNIKIGSRTRKIYKDKEIKETRSCVHKSCFKDFGSVKKLSPHVYASWGDFTTPAFCEGNQLATGFKFEWEPHQGSGDDTFGNGFYMYCNARNDDTSGAMKTIGGSGPWPERYQIFDCKNGYYLYGIQLNSEGGQGGGLRNSGDDTALNNVRMWCRNPINGHEYQLGQANAPTDGKWSTRVNCPTYYGMMGVQLQIEPKQGGGDNDDTSLGKIIPYCAPINQFMNAFFD